MSRIFSTDAERDKAAALRRLLMRVENGRGDDRDLAADILNAIDAPTLVGDPVALVQSALYVARILRLNVFQTLSASINVMRERIAAGRFERSEEVTEGDIARMVCAVALRVEIAKLERAAV